MVEAMKLMAKRQLQSTVPKEIYKEYWTGSPSGNRREERADDGHQSCCWVNGQGVQGL